MATARQKQTLCVLDDHRVHRFGLVAHLKKLGFRVALATPDVTRFFEALDGHLPALAVIDVSHPSGDRLKAVARLGQFFPALRTLAVVGDDSEAAAERCRALGAWRAVPRPVATSKQIASVIEDGADGRNHTQPFSPAVATALTPKEREIVDQIALGADNLKIAALFGITERTVKSHVTNIYRKLGAQSRVELALLARGLLAG